MGAGGAPRARPVSVIVPALDEAATIEATLAPLQPLRRRGHEVLVVDGGSADDTRARAAPLADRVLRAARGRARQMNAGVEAARGTVLLFVHADTRLPGDADRLVLAAVGRRARAWGRFDVRLDGRGWLLYLVGAAMNLRSRWTGIATGDQALFVTRALFVEVGGFPDLPLMEDIAVSARLRARTWPIGLRERVRISARRWRRDGTLRTILRMWSLRAAYACGADPRVLARHYDHVR